MVKTGILLSKHTAMTNKEILRASLLDIIFENRNKEYGAYALRNDYNHRLLKALGIGLGSALLLILLNFFNSGGPSSGTPGDDRASLTITEVDFEKEKPKEPEKPKEIVKPKTAQVDYQTIIVVPDDKVKDKLPDITDIQNAAISDKTADGAPDNQSQKIDLNATNNGNSAEVKHTDPTPDFIIREKQPEFPGGLEALTRFMQNNLITPDELEAGEKKIIKVKFIVGKDGSITDITIVESPGKAYEKEVSRVIKKMPRWKPGIQNDINVAVGYMLPVTFVGVE
jgi:protein TonB